MNADAQSLDEGVYRLDDGSDIAIAAWDLGRGDDALSFLDIDTGRFGLLRPDGDGGWISGPSLLVDEPIEITVRAIRDEQRESDGLLWMQGDMDTRRGTKAGIRRQVVSFANGGMELEGTLFLPVGAGPHPAVVLVHGSGPGRRETFGTMPYAFASRGIAALAFDKRGSGVSTGDWRRASFDDLAGDVVAAMELLAHRSDVDATRVGLCGSSQGGWIAPLAATQWRPAAFVIVLCGSGVSPGEQSLHENLNRLRQHGYADDALNQARALLELRNEVARTDEKWGQLETAAAAARQQPWFHLIDEPPAQGNPAWRFLRRINDHDPLPAWRTVTCPVLALFGERDPFISVERSIERIGQAVAEAGNRDVTLQVLPGAYHSLIQTDTGREEEFPHFKRFAAGFPRVMLEWTAARVAQRR